MVFEVFFKFPMKRCGVTGEFKAKAAMEGPDSQKVLELAMEVLTNPGAMVSFRAMGQETIRLGAVYLTRSGKATLAAYPNYLHANPKLREETNAKQADLNRDVLRQFIEGCVDKYHLAARLDAVKGA